MTFARFLNLILVCFLTLFETVSEEQGREERIGTPTNKIAAAFSSGCCSPSWAAML